MSAKHKPNRRRMYPRSPFLFITNPMYIPSAYSSRCPSLPLALALRWRLTLTLLQPVHHPQCSPRAQNNRKITQFLTIQQPFCRATRAWSPCATTVLLVAIRTWPTRRPARAGWRHELAIIMTAGRRSIPSHPRKCLAPTSIGSSSAWGSTTSLTTKGEHSSKGPVRLAPCREPVGHSEMRLVCAHLPAVQPRAVAQIAGCHACQARDHDRSNEPALGALRASGGSTGTCRGDGTGRARG